jgi:peptidoglycan/xylan/chitin deacetylase (PgdA/CDA1 family)
MSWLDPVRRALDELSAPVVLFFRVDDAGRGDVRLAAMLDRFEAHQVGVDVAVIPALVRRPLASALRGRIDTGGVRIHQHGLLHVNHERAGRKHEFGPARDLSAQTADVATGRNLLLGWFGEADVDPVFTPPWNRCTPDTGRALRANGLSVLSRDRSAAPLLQRDLAEVPITLDWFGHRRGVRWTPGELAARLADQVGGRDPIGVMLHHAVTNTDELGRVDDLLALCAQSPTVRIVSIVDLAEVTASGSAEHGGGS